MTIRGCTTTAGFYVLGGLCAAVLCIGMAGTARAEITAQPLKPVMTAANSTGLAAARIQSDDEADGATDKGAPPVTKSSARHKKKAESTSPAASKHAEGDTKTCLSCHETPDVVQILETPHAKKADSRTPYASGECESCHGASPNHLPGADSSVEPKRENVEVVFTKNSPTPIAKQNEMCLSCHQNGLRMNWQGSQHQSNDLACASCHTIHVRKDPVLVRATMPEKCFTCHAEQRAQSYMLSHHPIREGKVVCSDCHNPHGTNGPKLLKEDNVNDTCYTCHTEKRGPFLWEHEPVREDCTNCHLPHGSNQARLLKDRLPFLCQDCHNTGGHNANPFSASNLPGGELAPPNFRSAALPPGPLGNGTTSVSPRMIARGCVNCHSNIHGSNSPSGQYFER